MFIIIVVVIVIIIIIIIIIINGSLNCTYVKLFCDRQYHKLAIPIPH